MTPVIHASAVHDVEFKPINRTKSFKTSQMRNLIKLCPDCQQTFTDRLVLLRCELYYLQAYHEHPWCNNFGKKKKKHPTFSLNFFHILTYPFLILFRPLHASIYEKCLVRDLSLRQSRSLLYHFLWNIHFIWRPVDCPRASISRYTIILHKRWSPQAICI